MGYAATLNCTKNFNAYKSVYSNEKLNLRLLQLTSIEICVFKFA